MKISENLKNKVNQAKKDGLNAIAVSKTQNDFWYEFHLSTEPNLIVGKSFSNQIRTNSEYGERGNMESNNNNAIFSTSNPESWYDQFEMELSQDAPEAIPKFLYIVKVKNKSDDGYLSQSVNTANNVVVIKKVPNKFDGTPNFNLGDKMLNNFREDTKEML